LYTTYRMEDSLDADEPRLQELAQFSDNEDFCEEIRFTYTYLYCLDNGTMEIRKENTVT